MKEITDNKFHRRGFAIFLTCSAILLCIGLLMLVGDINSTGLMTFRFCNPIEQTISWHTPIFCSIILLGIALLWLSFLKKSQISSKMMISKGVAIISSKKLERLDIA